MKFPNLVMNYRMLLDNYFGIVRKKKTLFFYLMIKYKCDNSWEYPKKEDNIKSYIFVNPIFFFVE